MYFVSIEESRKALKIIMRIIQRVVKFAKVTFKILVGILTQSLNITQLKPYREPRY